MIAFALVRHRFHGRAVDQPADLHADGDARGRHGLVAADAVRQPDASRWAHSTILIAHIMFCISFVVVTVKARHRRPRPAARAGGDGPLRQRAADVPADHAAAGGARASRRRRCCRSRCRSTTTSSRTSTRARASKTFPMFVWGAAQRGTPVADQRHRHGDVRRLAPRSSVARPARRGVRRVAAPASSCTAARAIARSRLRRRAARRRTGWPTRHAPNPRPALVGQTSADLVVVGGGYTGLWTALLAKERDPGRDVVLLEAARRAGPPPAATAASARRQPDPRHSATASPGSADEHADAAAARPREPRRDRGDPRPLRASTASSSAPASSTSPTAPWQVAELRERAERSQAATASTIELLDARRGPARRSTRRPTSAGCSTATAPRWSHPAKLAWGLREACLRARVRIYERTAVTSLTEPTAPASRSRTPYGVGAGRAGRAGHQRRSPRCCAGCARTSSRSTTTSLVTEPLSRRAARRRSAGASRQGIGDVGQPVPLLPAHRRRPDPLGRLRRHLPLRRTACGAELEQRPRDLRDAGRALLRDVPAARGPALHPRLGRRHRHLHPVLRRSGAPRYDGRVAYVAGYTGLGVGATRFGAQVMLDLLAAGDTERDRLRMVRTQAAAVPAGAVALGRHRAHPALARPRRRATRAGATCGCAPSTDSAWASTLSRDR